jgi:hypothetical protein
MVMMAIGLASSTQEVAFNLFARAKSPAGCVSSYDGPFQASIVGLNKVDSESLKKRTACGSGSQLLVTLSNGVLTDAQGRTGYIASNYQFQFDAPPQHGTLVDSGFSVCRNGTLALGDSTLFYQCTSGAFYNLYDRSWADQCSPVNLQVMPCSEIESVADVPAGKIVDTQMMQTTLVTVLKDGQPQVVPTVVPIPICQIGDGQVQGRTTPCAELPVPGPTSYEPEPTPSSPAPTAPSTSVAVTTATIPATTASTLASSSPTQVAAVAAGRAPSLVALVVVVAAAVVV